MSSDPFLALHRCQIFVQGHNVEGSHVGIEALHVDLDLGSVPQSQIQKNFSAFIDIFRRHWQVPFGFINNGDRHETQFRSFGDGILKGVNQNCFAIK